MQYRLKDYVFEGQHGGVYSTRSIQMMVSEAKAKAGVKKKGSVHLLRHRYVTRLMESGTDVRFIQERLGHNSITRTMRYTYGCRKTLQKLKVH